LTNELADNVRADNTKCGESGKLFDIGKEIVVYTSIEDLDNKVKYYLENEDERNMIAESGHQRVKRDHTYLERAKKLIEIINEN
jgi:spore maturation protein CgeB